ncbi:MAG: ABC transporter ATP-binding protein [Verrucomicrobiales bacterium]|nr:ABC transporter ATP-binding protein [Verrucomicrobiales bacterium]
MIEIENLSMSYGDLRALDGLTLTIPKGELFAFLGPNGAGKTTAIKLLTGLMKPDEGGIRISGFDLNTQPIEAKRRLGYVPDVAQFYEKLTPSEFMEFIAELFEMDRDKAAAETDALFTQFALQEYAAKRVENLSHGTRQRLAIASALLHQPEVIIIDEPMVGLDPIHARIVKDELKARSRAGATVLMSTHLLNIAEEVADRIGILHRGRLVALGRLEELRTQRARDGMQLEELFLDFVR